MASPLYNETLLRKYCAESKTIAEVLEKFGLRAAGGNYKQLRLACAMLEVSPPKVDRGALCQLVIRRTPDEEVFIEHSRYRNGTNIKQRLLALGWAYVCAECGLGGTWNGRELKLQLDHINGVHDDNRLENLRFICPNCHTQTTTFAGKHIKARLHEKNQKRCACGKPISKDSTRCRKCQAAQPQTKIVWPSHEELCKMVAASSKLAVGKALGVSDVAVHQRLLRGHDPENPINWHNPVNWRTRGKGKAPKHGTAWAYRKGCRCDDCRAAKRQSYIVYYSKSKQKS